MDTGNAATPRLEVTSRWLAGLAGLIGLIVCAGWAARMAPLTSLVSGWPSMSIYSAAGLVLLSAAVFLSTSKGKFAALALVLLLIVAALGFVTLVEYGTSSRILPDLSFHSSAASLSATGGPHRVSAWSAVCFMLLSAALLAVKLARQVRFAEVLVHCALLVSAYRLVAYLLGTWHAGYAGNAKIMSFPSAVAFLLLGGAILFTLGQRGALGVLLSERSGGRLARMLLPAALALPFFSAWLRMRLEGEGILASGEGAALGALLNGGALALIVLLGGRLLNLSDAERAAGEEQLRESETRLRQIYESPMQGIFYWNADGSIVGANQKFLDLVGYSAEDLAAGRMRWNEMTPEEYHDIERAKFAEVQATGSIVPYEKEFVRQDGTRRPVFIGAAIMEGAGPYGVAFALDMTAQQQQRRELEASNAELDSFSYSVSHDLRAPLRSIEGFSRALEEDYGDRLDDEGRHYINRIRAGTIKMGQLIDDLLHLARVSRADVRKAPIDFSALAEMVAAQLMESSDRQVEWRIQPGVTAFGDSRLLRIVLENLFGNALKFTSKQDQALIEFGQESTERGNAYYVRDNGAGFEMEYAGKLFAAFQRLHSPQEYPGTGIGLATVRRIINRHGGEISASGELGRGAKFSFTLDS